MEDFRHDLGNKNLNRGGLIPYIKTKNGRLYLLAIDHDYQTLIDFGGHREPEDRDIIETIQREVSEESCDSLGPFTREKLLSGEVFMFDGNVEILLKIDADPEKLSRKIRKALSRAESLQTDSLESVGVVWVPEERLRLILEMDETTVSHFLYPRIYYTLRNDST